MVRKQGLGLPLPASLAKSLNCTSSYCSHGEMGNDCEYDFYRCLRHINCIFAVYMIACMRCPRWRGRWTRGRAGGSSRWRRGTCDNELYRANEIECIVA